MYPVKKEINEEKYYVDSDHECDEEFNEVEFALKKTFVIVDILVYCCLFFMLYSYYELGGISQFLKFKLEDLYVFSPFLIYLGWKYK